LLVEALQVYRLVKPVRTGFREFYMRKRVYLGLILWLAEDRPVDRRAQGGEAPLLNFSPPWENGMDIV